MPLNGDVGQVATIPDVLKMLLDYCVQRNEFGGYWLQNEYLDDLFKIFHCAYLNQVVGWNSHRRYKAAFKKNKATKPFHHTLHHETVGEYLNEHFLAKKYNTKANREMVEGIVTKWEEWTYAWDRFPANLPLPFGHKRTKRESPLKWVRDKEKVHPGYSYSAGDYVLRRSTHVDLLKGTPYGKYVLCHKGEPIKASECQQPLKDFAEEHRRLPNS